MFGLIKKDLLFIKKNIKLLLIITVAYSFIALGGDFDIVFIIPFLATMLFISTFSYDDFNNWNSYAITLPSGRVSIIRSKYIAGLIIALVSVIIGLIISCGTSFFTSTAFNLATNIEELMGILFSIIVLISLMFPFIFKFGSEKGRIWIFGIVFGLAAFLGIISRFVDFNNLKDIFKIIDKMPYLILPCLEIIILSGSYLISKQIYLHKEF